MALDLQPLNLPGMDTRRPTVIAGPCSAETEEQVMTTAAALCAAGYKIFRAGIWKPRTKPGGFEGNGITALPWLRRVHEELDMLTATEVATAEHVRAALDYGVDILWIGARTAVGTMLASLKIPKATYFSSIFMIDSVKRLAQAPARGRRRCVGHRDFPDALDYNRIVARAEGRSEQVLDQWAELYNQQGEET